MPVRLIIALLIGKLIYFIARNLKIGGGSAAPGHFALKICPDLIERTALQIPRSAIITGTNGKTTTSKMLSHFAKASNLRVLRNATGSNLERGVASALVAHADCFGRIKDADFAIWETDEAIFGKLAKKLNPSLVVFLNVSRDQLDRYGEVDKVIASWRKALYSLNPKTVLILNGDDPYIKSLSESFRGPVQFFGVKEHMIKHEAWNQLGTKHSISRRERFLDFEATNAISDGLSGTSFRLEQNGEGTAVKLPIPGTYHVYDFLASYACAHNLGLNMHSTLSSLKTYSPAFGRVEKFTFPSVSKNYALDGYIFLIKNPAGSTQVFETISSEVSKHDTLLIALNDNFADGKDVSWIWDANFEKLLNSSSERKSREFKIYASGQRAEDLAVRLKYAGFNARRISVEPSLEKALETAKRGLEGRLFILPTYTALLDLQRLLTRLGIKKHYWKEG